MSVKLLSLFAQLGVWTGTSNGSVNCKTIPSLKIWYINSAFFINTGVFFK